MTVHIALSDFEPTLGQNESEPWRSLQHIRGDSGLPPDTQNTHISSVNKAFFWLLPTQSSYVTAKEVCPPSHHKLPST